MLATRTNAVPVPVATNGSADGLIDWKQVIGSADSFLHAVNTRIGEQIREFDPQIATYAEYALTGQGKHLRPVLVALSAGATGKVTEAHERVAVIIEIVHLATLVHDDVMDEASMRRGRPTLASNWGNEISVLLGDCLFAHALKLAASFPTPEVCRAVAAATNTVCAGELLQTKGRNNFECSHAEYFKIVSMKTGELFALSCDLGAFLNGAEPERRSALRHYGLAMGTAYQVYDDCLDLFGSETAAGKSLGTDLAKGKMTLPMLLLWQRMSVHERSKIKALVQDWVPGHLPGLLQMLKSHDMLNQACLAVHQYLAKARSHLNLLPASESRTALFDLTHYLARQTDSLEA